MAGVLLILALNRDLIFSKLTLKSGIRITATQQFKSIFMMLTVAIIGLVPAVLSKGIGSDVQRPLATVIIGGLTSTLIFTPFILPHLFYRENKSRIQPQVQITH